MGSRIDLNAVAYRATERITGRRMAADTMLGGRIDANAGGMQYQSTAISSDNADAISANMRLDRFQRGGYRRE